MNSTKKRHHRSNTKSSRPWSTMDKTTRRISKAIFRTAKKVKGKFENTELSNAQIKEWR